MTGKLLGYSSGFVIQTKNKIEVYKKVAGFEFPTLPDGFFVTPTLNWKVWSKNKLKSKVEVAYRTNGFSWKADYSISLDEKEEKADIGGWVTIDNHSGKKYVDAKLKLIAGDVNRIQNNYENNYL